MRIHQLWKRVLDVDQVPSNNHEAPLCQRGLTYEGGRPDHYKLACDRRASTLLPCHPTNTTIA